VAAEVHLLAPYIGACSHGQQAQGNDRINLVILASTATLHQQRDSYAGCQHSLLCLNCCQALQAIRRQHATLVASGYIYL
jgi:hypothetical protein